MSASVAVYRNVYTEDRFRQTYGTEDPSRGRERLRDRLTQRCSCSQVDCLHLLKKRLPVCSWLPKYKLKKWLLGDIIAGLTVGIVHIPQGKQTKKLFYAWNRLKDRNGWRIWKKLFNKFRWYDHSCEHSFGTIHDFEERNVLNRFF